MADETEEKLRYRKIAALLLIAGILVLFFVVTPRQNPSLLKEIGMAAAFLLFPASVYFNFRAREESRFNLPLKESIAILLVFLALVAAFSYFY